MINIYSGDNKKIKRPKIIITGEFSYTPLGRHALSFVDTLEGTNVDIYLNVIVGGHAEQKFSETLKRDNVFSYDANLHNFTFDFSVYTHIIPSFHDHCQFTSLNFNLIEAHVKAYYSVFDGTVPPLFWIPFINENFDLCLAPSRYIANILSHYGVDIPCIGLHCAVFSDELLQKSSRDKKTDDDVFRFGFVGTIDFKKDVVTAIDAFVEAFGTRKDVELRLHLTGIPDQRLLTKINARLEAARRGDHNIVVTAGHIKQSELEDIFSSFDVYIFPQNITGYFTTLAEALALGLPVITSKIPPLLELQDYISADDNIEFVETNGLIPAYHSFINYMMLGAGFKNDVGLFTEAMLDVYENRSGLYSDELIAQRKQAALQLTPKGLSKKWQNLIQPNKICVRTDHISGLDEETLVCDRKLFDKYVTIFPDIYELSKEKVNFKIPSEHYDFLDSKEHQIYEDVARYHQELMLSFLESRAIATGEHITMLMTANQDFFVKNVFVFQLKTTLITLSQIFRNRKLFAELIGFSAGFVKRKFNKQLARLKK